MTQHQDKQHRERSQEAGFIRAMAREILVRHPSSMTVESALYLAEELIHKSTSHHPTVTHTHELPDHDCKSHSY
jgi:hypothetical protein